MESRLYKIKERFMQHLYKDLDRFQRLPNQLKHLLLTLTKLILYQIPFTPKQNKTKSIPINSDINPHLCTHPSISLFMILMPLFWNNVVFQVSSTWIKG